MFNLRKDTVLRGILIGLLLPTCSYALLLWLNDIQGRWVSPAYHEKLQLFLLAVNGALMYYMMTRRQQDETGKGIMGVTMIMAFVYIVYYYIL